MGDLVPGRCKATNLCDYCARLAAVENAEVLAQDALHNGAPEVWSIVGTRTATLDMGRFKHAREKVTATVKRQWPESERATLIEYTTGYGTRAEGKRRPHWNDLWKNVPAGEVEDLHDRVSWAWCKYVDATVEAQHAGRVRDVGGLMRYLALHFQKESQQPPKGWRGHRFTTSRGYLGEPMAAARERARDALRLRRELWKLERATVVDADTGERVLLASLFTPSELWDMAETRHGERKELAWTLVRLQDVPASFTEDGDPAAWRTVALPVNV